ncbi:penicillin-binding protein 1A [Candidatus Albibeggiatoa sp. nov. NOAA]|uniref:penicillin-binding protein 1A n=1 Tax=Candidatus Albibeggiatoa sp. nov. NOAA TaxID=3162724 RepID=UPI0032F75415|nr:penicillin-binding protein 1A [Thiotrichaceae bacterium]
MIRTYFYTMLRVTLLMTLLLGLFAATGVAVVVGYFLPQLPSIEHIKSIDFQIPLRVYSHDGKYMAEFGTQRRIPIEVHKIPPMMIHAMLATEDNKFFEHSGVNFKSLVRAAVHLVKTRGEIRQGGSTITMQVAKNLFLTPERSFDRKFKEILLALRIEQTLTKDEILELYFNKIYFGQRAYGIQAASYTYYSRPLKELEVAEYAMLAGIPKFPSSSNPIADPTRAMERRNYILRRMNELGYIDKTTYETSVQQPNTAKLYKAETELNAPHVAEMARQYMEELYGDAAYTKGFNVYTTVRSSLQNSAQRALRRNLLNYDERHGYRGVSGHVELPEATEELAAEEITKVADKALKDYPNYGGLLASVVMKVNKQSIVVYNKKVGEFTINWKNLRWARRYVHDNRRGGLPKTASAIVKRGDVIMARQVGSVKNEAGEKVAVWRLSEVPQVEGALVSLDPNTGAILSLAGGFDFYQSKFNRVTQAFRQPGSNFKPFIYSAALEHGFTPASMINDAPVVFRAGNKLWKPKNFTHRFYGPTNLRTALTFSRNLVSIRLLNNIGVTPAIEHVVKFGFERDRIPKNLTISLGTGDVTPLELARGYAAFANGGYLIKPYIVSKIENMTGHLLFKTDALEVCKNCPEYTIQSGADLDQPQYSHAPRVIDDRNAWTLTSMMKDVIKRGTAVRAMKLKRSDLAGKTGTTNDQRDAWFSGFNANIVTTAWIGFDRPRSLGKKETGSRAALPMWIDYMRQALQSYKVRSLAMPQGIVSAKIDPATGFLATSQTPNAKFEYFYKENVPKRYAIYKPTDDSSEHALTLGEPLF